MTTFNFELPTVVESYLKFLSRNYKKHDLLKINCIARLKSISDIKDLCIFYPGFVPDEDNLFADIYNTFQTPFRFNSKTRPIKNKLLNIDLNIFYHTSLDAIRSGLSQLKKI